MPDELVTEQIVVAYIEQLKTIEAGAIYHNTIKDENVIRYVQTIDQMAVERLLQVIVGDTLYERVAMPRHDSAAVSIAVVGFVHHTNEHEIAREMNRLIRDVHVATTSNPTLGGLSMRVDVESVATDEGLFAYEGYAMFEFGVSYTYHYNWGSP